MCPTKRDPPFLVRKVDATINRPPHSPWSDPLDSFDHRLVGSEGGGTGVGVGEGVVVVGGPMNRTCKHTTPEWQVLQFRAHMRRWCPPESALSANGGRPHWTMGRKSESTSHASSAS